MRCAANNPTLQASPMYLGSQAPRCGDMEYFELMDSFMDAVYTRYSTVCILY